MKRLMLLAAAAASLAAALPAGPAAARDHGRGYDRGEARSWTPRQQSPEVRGYERWSDNRAGRRTSYQGSDGREPAQDNRRRNEEAPRRRYDDEPRRDRSAPAEAAQPKMLRTPSAPGARRGGYLPDTYRGAVIDDYRAYRLRPPPRGFSWVRVGSGYALVDMSDGRIYDVVQ